LLEEFQTTEPSPQPASRTARRTFFVITLIAVAALVAAAVWQVPNLVRDESNNGIAVSAETNPEHIVKSANGRVFASTIVDHTTKIEELTSTRTTLATLLGEYTIRIADRDGARLALADPLPDGADIYRPGPRSVTHLVTFDTATRTTRHYDIPRNVEPEAFGIDAALLFVIDHRPAAQPDHYRVAYVDLQLGAFNDVIGPDKTPLDVDMSGTARQQVPSASGEQLYTLYVHHGHDSSHDEQDPAALSTAAFVHVLDLRGAWAYCVDLPAFGHGPVESAAITISDDGRSLFVADTRAGQLATISTAELSTERLAANPPLVTFADLPGSVERDAPITLEASNTEVVVHSATEALTYDTASRSWR
jgi:hypothetical protein